MVSISAFLTEGCWVFFASISVFSSKSLWFSGWIFLKSRCITWQDINLTIIHEEQLKWSRAQPFDLSWRIKRKRKNDLNKYEHSFKKIKQTNTINKMVFVLVYQCVYLVYLVSLIYKNENLKFIQFDFVFTIWFSYEDDFVFKKKVTRSRVSKIFNPLGRDRYLQFLLRIF